MTTRQKMALAFAGPVGILVANILVWLHLWPGAALLVGIGYTTSLVIFALHDA